MNDTLRDALNKDRPGYPEKRADFSTTELQLMEWYCKGISIADISTRLDLSARTINAILERLLFKTKTNGPASLAQFIEERELFKVES
jgi:DNA-binding CsgD family transcriptional regulator